VGLLGLLALGVFLAALAVPAVVHRRAGPKGGQP
jgi:hypothetical protein